MTQTERELKKEVSELRRILQVLSGDLEWLTPEKVQEQYGYSRSSLRKFYSAGKVGIKKGKSGKTILYKRADIEDLFITIPKHN